MHHRNALPTPWTPGLSLLALALAIAGCKADAPSKKSEKARAARAPTTDPPALESRAEPRPARRALGKDGAQRMGEAFKQLKAAAKTLTPSLNDFSLALAREVPPDAQGNRLLSPWCVTSALHPVMLGARGETEAEMRKALHASLPGHSQHASLRLLNLRVQRAGGAPTTRLRLASRVWGAERYPLRPDFVTLLGKLHAAELVRLDFRGKNAEALQTVNRWVAEQTAGKIPALLKSLSPETQLLVTSAAEFHGEWAARFPVSDTREEPFRAFAGDTRAPLMRQKGTFHFAEAEGAKILALPYQGRQFSMLVLLPAPGKEAFEAFERRLDAAQLARLRASLQPAEVSVFLPRFRHRTREELRSALQALGMKRAFAREADFSGLTDAKEPFWMSQVQHEVFVAVHEQGTEAAAATASAVAGGPPPAAPRELRADRPFLFFILHERSGTVLFHGRVGTPRNAD